MRREGACVGKVQCDGLNESGALETKIQTEYWTHVSISCQRKEEDKNALNKFFITLEL